MAHIQRGDNRQYYQQVASKTNIGDMALLANQALNTGVSITQKANESTLANNQIDLTTKFLAKNNEINTKWQADPTNPEREVEIQEAFEELANSYDINPVCQGQWNTIKNNVYGKFKTHNAQWIEKQQDTNAQVFLKNGCEQLINQAFMLGKSGASADEIRLVYANGSEALKKGTTARLGEVFVGEAMHEVTHDFMANYLNGVIESNPAQAIKDLENESILNDIGNPDTIKKLKHSAQQKMLKQTEIEAVNRVADYIVKNNDIYSKAIDGTLTTSEALDFINDKEVDPMMKKVLSNMLGYDEEDIVSGAGTNQKQIYSTLVLGNKQWTFVNEKGKLRQPTTQEKDEITSELYLEGSRLLNGIEGQTPQQQIRQIAEYQSKLAQASYFGVDKSDYDKMMNTFVLPATKDIQAQAEKYNANMSSWNYWGDRYGWQQIDKHFNDMLENIDKPTKQDKEQIAKEKSLASVYYWTALNNYASQRGIAVTDIFGLSREERGEIYNKSAKEAIEKAKATSQTPSLWFRSANPQYVSQIRNMLPNSNANNVITNVAVASMSNPNMSDNDFNQIVDREIRKEYAKMRTQNKAVAFSGNTKYDEIINNYSMMYGIDPLLVKAVIKQESGFNPNAESSAGAGGLMQLMPATARSLGVKNIYDPKQNIAGGTKYLAQLLKKYDGNIPLALSAYNAGMGNVEKYGNKIPPFKETQNYVKNIMNTYNSTKG